LQSFAPCLVYYPREFSTEGLKKNNNNNTVGRYRAGSKNVSDNVCVSVDSGVAGAGRMMNGPTAAATAGAGFTNGVYHASLVHQPLASMAAAAAVADQYRYPESVAR